MIEKGDKVLVGVSGGPDSTALLHILHEMKDKLGIRLYVAHLNHNVRGGASEADEEFVKAGAQKLNLPFYSKKLSKAALKAKGSKEELMRNERYKFLADAAERFKANKIALAHTSDDQAETVLMRLIKGSGLKGLGGIPPMRLLGKCTLIRPLIKTSKKEVLIFLKKKNLSYRKDATNFDEAYLRNSIRRRLIPFIEKKYNPKIKKSLCEISDIAREDDAYIEEAAHRAFKKCLTSKLQIQISKFQKLPIALRRRVLRIAIEQVKGNLRRLEFRHLEAIEGLISAKAGKLDLPCGIIAEVNSMKKHSSYSIKSEVLNNGWAKKGFTRIIKKKNKLVEYFDYDKLRLPIKVRFRKSGDRMSPFGMEGSKLLKELYIDEKVDRNLRDQLPLVLSGRDIIWAAGVRRSSLAPVAEGTKRVIKFSLRPSNNGFTLLEVLIGITIIAAVITGTMGAFVAARKATFHSRNKISALHFAKDTAERLKDYVTYNTADPKYKDASGTYALLGGKGTNITHTDTPVDWGEFGKFKPARSYDVTDVDSNGDNIVDYKKVIITVTWDEPKI